MLQTKDFSKEDARRFVADCFSDLARGLDQSFVAETADPELELAEQVAVWDEVNCNVTEQLASKAFHGPVTATAYKAAQQQGLDLDELSLGSKQDVLAGVSRALLEAHRLFLFRIEEQILPYNPADPLFAAPPPAQSMPAFAPSQAPMPIALGPSVQVVTDQFLQSGKQSWTPKTYKSRMTRMGYLVDFLGGDRPLSGVTTAEVRTFSEGLLKFRNRNTCQVGKTFAEKQTDNPKHRINPETAKLIFITIKAFFNWAKSKKGYIERNPAEDIEMDVPKAAKKAQKARRPFTTDELTKLFSAPLFTGCQAVHRRFNPGRHVYRDDFYWIPILGYFTGMRLGEIVQLHIADVVLDGPIPYLDVTDLNSGEFGSNAHKSIKSEAGVRKVPLHPDLMALGFADFIAHRRKEKHAASKRVFWKTAYGADGQASTVFSKWFSRFLDKVGLSDPALVFHSFRHNAEDSFRNALLPQQVIDRIIGHSDDATSAGYGEGLWLETAYDAVKTMKLRVSLSTILIGEP